jgi:hypothetical protein
MSAALGLVGHSGIITACVNVRAFGYVPSIEKVVYSEHDLWYSAMVNTPLKASLLLPKCALYIMSSRISGLLANALGQYEIAYYRPTIGHYATRVNVYYL